MARAVIVVVTTSRRMLAVRVRLLVLGAEGIIIIILYLGSETNR